MESNSKNEIEEQKDTQSIFEKIIHANKLGALFLAGDNIDKALIILLKTFNFYKEKKESKEIPNFIYSNLYCNLAKAYSCKRQFFEAEKIYIECIIEHSLYKILKNNNEFMISEFNLNVEKIIEIKKDIDSDEISKKFELINKYFDIIHGDQSIRSEFENKILHKFKPNNLSSLSSFADSLVNLAVIFQHNFKETITAFNMYFLAILCEPTNSVANINFNNFLREIDQKDKSDVYIKKRIKYDYYNDNFKQESIDFLTNEINLIEAIKHDKKNETKHINFICMKWGKKYGADYVNKLYRGVKRNYSKSFSFYCITDDAVDLETEIKILKLESSFKGWMKKCILFSPKYIIQMEGFDDDHICFIDLDMIICNNIDFLSEYSGVKQNL